MIEDLKYNQRGFTRLIVLMLAVLILFVVSFVFVMKKPAVEKIQEEVSVKKKISWEDGAFVDILIGEANISAEVAKSENAKEKGLSNRMSLEEGKGMIFIFDNLGIYPFWNKETLIPLDLLWIENDTIVYIGELPAFSGGETSVVTPNQKANFVLEANSGFIKKHNIKIGDKVIINR